MKQGNYLVAVLFFILTSIFLFPLKDGLILLPLDLLVSNYGPWHMAGQILLKNPYMQDSILQYFPWHHLVFESITNGIVPFWNPYQNMGMPFMASAKPMLFYPLNVFFIFGQLTQWHISIFLQFFLTMIFTYALAQDFKLGKPASILSAISFSMCSLMIGFSEFVSDSAAIIWIPLFILFAKKFIDKGSGKYLFFLGISISLSIFAGHFQYTGYGLTLLGVFVLYYGRLKKINIKNFGFIFASIGFGILISSIQLFPALELFKNSFRGISNSHGVFSADLIIPNHLLRLFSPDFFGNPTQRNLTSGYIETSGYFGIISFFFALYAILYANKNNIVKFFATSFLVAAFFALKWPAEIIYFLKIPLLTSGSGGRIFGLVLLSGSILAGFGLEEFLKGKAKKNILSILLFGLLFGIGILLNYKRTLFFHDISFQILIFGIFVVLSLAYLYLRRGGAARFTRALAMITLVPWKSIGTQLNMKKFSWATSAHIFALLIIFLTFLDLFRLGYRYMTFSNSKFLYPQTSITEFIRQNSKQTLARSFGVTEPEIDTYLGLYSIETYNPLYIQRNGQLLQTLQKLPASNLPVNKIFLTDRSDNLKFALDFTGVSYVAVPKDSSPSHYYFNTGNFQGSFTKIIGDSVLDLYKNNDAFPRFGLYYKYRVASSNEQLKILSSPSLNPRKEVLLEEKLPAKLIEGTGSAKLISSNINSQKFEVKTNKTAIFYISDTYFPGWTAKINGEESKLYRANYNFRAVLAPAGSSTIEFSYLPTHFILGLKISAISLILLAALSFFSKRKN